MDDRQASFNKKTGLGDGAKKRDLFCAPFPNPDLFFCSNNFTPRIQATILRVETLSIPA
jgi:hypothetical protein